MKLVSQFNNEQRAVLNDIHTLCCFESKKDSKDFWSKVVEAGELEFGETVSEDSFALAHMKAKEILLQQGRNIFKRRKSKFIPFLHKFTRAGQFRNI